MFNAEFRKADGHYTECLYSRWYRLLNVILSIIMLSVVRQSVSILSVIVLSAFRLRVVKLSFFRLSVVRHH